MHITSDVYTLTFVYHNTVLFVQNFEYCNSSVVSWHKSYVAWYDDESRMITYLLLCVSCYAFRVIYVKHIIKNTFQPLGFNQLMRMCHINLLKNDMHIYIYLYLGWQNHQVSILYTVDMILIQYKWILMWHWYFF